jgi:hypothetical protein
MFKRKKSTFPNIRPKKSVKVGGRLQSTKQWVRLGKKGFKKYGIFGRKKLIEDLKALEYVRQKEVQDLIDTKDMLEREGRMHPPERREYSKEINGRIENLLEIRKEIEKLEKKKGLKGLFVKSTR